MVFPEAVVGSSVTTKVLPALRDVTRVCTFGLSNSVIRVFGIASVKVLSSAAEGLSWIFFASTVTLPPLLVVSGNAKTAHGRAGAEILPGGAEANRAGLAGGFDLEVQPDPGAI